MPLALTQTQFDALRSGKPVRARGRVRHEQGAMNGIERAYSEHLTNLKLAGEIAWFAFESVKLRLAAKTFFTVDFFVMLPTGDLEAHEVKGFWQDDARVKIKVAASMYPFRFVAVKKEGGGWRMEEF
jgi:hypothetical protein